MLRIIVHWIGVKEMNFAVINKNFININYNNAVWNAANIFAVQKFKIPTEIIANFFYNR